MEGYVKLFRKLLKSTMFDNPNLLKVWIWCLLKATHRDHAQVIGLQKVELRPGQFIYGRNRAAEELKLKPSTTHRYMLWLKEVGNVDIKSNNKFSVVTVVNWELYQIEENKMDSNMDSKWTTNGQQMDTNKNGKNDKNIYTAFFESVWKLYPHKKGKGQVSDTQKAKLEKIGIEQLTRCIERYRKDKPDRQYWQHGSTFFNSGYVDYLDENYQQDNTVKDKTTPHPEGFEVIR